MNERQYTVKEQKQMIKDGLLYLKNKYEEALKIGWFSDEYWASLAFNIDFHADISFTSYIKWHIRRLKINGKRPAFYLRFNNHLKSGEFRISLRTLEYHTFGTSSIPDYQVIKAVK